MSQARCTRQHRYVIRKTHRYVGDSQQKTEEPGASLTLDLPNQFVTRGTNV